MNCCVRITRQPFIICIILALLGLQLLENTTAASWWQLSNTLIVAAVLVDRPGLQFEVQGLWAEDDKSVFLRWPGLVQGEFKSPQDMSHYSQLLVHGKLLANAVPEWDGQGKWGLYHLTKQVPSSQTM